MAELVEPEGAATPIHVPAGAPPPVPTATLAGILETVGMLVVEVRAAPRGLDVPVGEVVVYDRHDATTVEPDDIVLAVGVRAEEQEAREVIAHAASHGAAAVVCKWHGGSPEPLVEHAQHEGVALLQARREVAWGHLYAVLRTAAASVGEPLRAGGDDTPAGDLFALANAIATSVGGPVTIEDPHSRVLAYANRDFPVDESRRQTILGRQVPREWIGRLRQQGVFARLWSTDDVLEIDYADQQSRMAVGVRAGGVILGSIWAADGGRSFRPGAKSALREAASIAALHLVRHRVGPDLGRRLRGELLLSLLEGRGRVDVVGPRLGMTPETPSTVVAFELAPDPDEAGFAIRRERLMELVAMYSQAFRRSAAAVSIDATVYVLMPGDGPDVRAAVVRLASEVTHQALDVAGTEISAGIGSLAGHLRDVPKSREHADRALEVMARRRTGPRVASIDDVWSIAMLLELDAVIESRSSMRSPKIDLLVANDATQSTHYVETLRAYLEHLGETATAAKALQVHPNTFRYRMRRLVEVAELDLEDPDERLALQLQMRVLGSKPRRR